MSVYRTMMSVVKLMPHLTPELQQKAIQILEAYGPAVEAAEAGTTLVDDATIRAIVNEQRRGATPPSSMVPDKGSAPVKRGTGWQPEPKPEDRSNQFAQFDAMVAAQVGGPNDTSKLR